MGKRDWGGTVFVACLIALAGFLHDHTVPVVLLSAGAVASAAVVVWDVRGKKPRSSRAVRGLHDSPPGGGEGGGAVGEESGIAYLLKRSQASVRGAIETAETTGRLMREQDPPPERKEDQ